MKLYRDTHKHIKAFKLQAAGRSHTEIAEEMSISPATSARWAREGERLWRILVADMEQSVTSLDELTPLTVELTMAHLHLRYYARFLDLVTQEKGGEAVNRLWVRAVAES